MTNIVNMLAAQLKSYADVNGKAEKAKQTLETAEQARLGKVIAFADTCAGFGWTDLSPIKKGGEYREELEAQAAACILNKAELAAFNSNEAAYTLDKSGKRVYGKRHAAGNKVRNFLNRLIDAAEPHVDGTAAKKAAEKAERGANASKAKPLAEFLRDTLAAMTKRIGDDARKPTPTGKNHEELRKAVAALTKTVAELTK